MLVGNASGESALIIHNTFIEKMFCEPARYFQMRSF